jgi:tripartite-type tricarboxylate transporter receptor subunit TctC
MAPHKTFLFLASVLAAVAGAPGLSAPAAAQTFPDHPITLVVPYPAGGGNDVLARIVAESMGRTLGQQFVVENRGGAGGTIATRQVAKSAPDGYTLLIATSSLAINPSLYPNAGYDPRKDFAPVGLIASSANALLVHPSLPVHSVAELIALAKERPGTLDFASTGSGSSVHLAAELFATMAGIRLTHIPYKGSGPAIADLLGGHVALMFATLPPSIGLVKDGKVRALAVTGPSRSPLLPDLPTIAEAGLPGYESVLHYGLVAPAGTPKPAIDKLNAALRAALADESVRRRMSVEGAEALPSTPEAYAADIDHEEIKWSKIVQASGAKGE